MKVPPGCHMAATALVDNQVLAVVAWLIPGINCVTLQLILAGAIGV